MRKILSHALTTFVGVYIGLLLNSKLHLESLSTSVEQQFHAPPTSVKNETVRERVVDIRKTQEQKQNVALVDYDAVFAVENKHQAPKNPICQRLNPLAPPLTYWTRHFSRIHAASQLTPYDTKYHFHDFTAQLLHIISPRLPHSVLSVPHDWTMVEAILNKAFARYEYLQDPSNKPFQPPVKMVILGGSVLVGRNCRKLMKDLGIQGMLLPNRACTWAYRLQVFLDQFFGVPGIVEITKISMGGTNTNIGSQIFKYDLLPQAARNPDIVLNAYSTNDMHILTILEAQSNQNQTLRDRVFEMTQDFVRVIMQNRPCNATKPLLLHMDDYLGNEQREIWATTELAQGVGVLAHYYGFASMSYANVVRQWVYGDTRETWFSPEGWYPSKKSTKMEREIHPGMGMHITATWVVAYNLLNLATTYCSLEPWLRSTKDSMDYSKSFLTESLPLKGYMSVIPGKPKIPPQTLPPLLTQELRLETISDDWHASDERDRAQLESMTCSNGGGSTRCIFSWVSGMSQQHDNTTWIEEYFGPIWAENKGWKLVNDGGKIGYAPSAVGDEVVLEFKHLSQPIRTVTFFTLKSYGSKWENSKLRVIIQGRSDDGDWKELVRDEIVGSHDKETSEMYTKEIKFPVEAKEGTFLQVRCRLESGETFKIMGLAVCS